MIQVLQMGKNLSVINGELSQSPAIVRIFKKPCEYVPASIPKYLKKNIYLF